MAPKRKATPQSNTLLNMGFYKIAKVDDESTPSSSRVSPETMACPLCSLDITSMSMTERETHGDECAGEGVTNTATSPSTTATSPTTDTPATSSTSVTPPRAFIPDSQDDEEYIEHTNGGESIDEDTDGHDDECVGDGNDESIDNESEESLHDEGNDEYNENAEDNDGNVDEDNDRDDGNKNKDKVPGRNEIVEDDDVDEEEDKDLQDLVKAVTSKIPAQYQLPYRRPSWTPRRIKLGTPSSSFDVTSPRARQYQENFSVIVKIIVERLCKEARASPWWWCEETRKLDEQQIGFSKAAQHMLTIEKTDYIVNTILRYFTKEAKTLLGKPQLAPEDLESLPRLSKADLDQWGVYITSLFNTATGERGGYTGSATGEFGLSQRMYDYDVIVPGRPNGKAHRYLHQAMIAEARTVTCFRAVATGFDQCYPAWALLTEAVTMIALPHMTFESKPSKFASTAMRDVVHKCRADLRHAGLLHDFGGGFRGLNEANPIRQGFRSGKGVPACRDCGRDTRYPGDDCQRYLATEGEALGAIICRLCYLARQSGRVRGPETEMKRAADRIPITSKDGKITGFRCPRHKDGCTVIVARFPEIRKHVSQTHPRPRKSTGAQPRPWKCGYCDSSFPNESALETHVNIHTKEKTFPCPRCSENCSSSVNLSRHLKRKHPWYYPFHCDLCPEKFNMANKLRHHRRMAHVETRLDCECGAPRFKTKSAIRWHRERVCPLRQEKKE